MTEQKVYSNKAEESSANEVGSIYRMSADRRRGAYPPRPTGSGIRVGRKPGRSSTVGHSILISHVRTFTLVAVFMGGLLGLAIYITGQAWQGHISRARDSRSAERPRETPAVQTDAGIVVDGDSGMRIPRARAELDTESMRRALVMQSRAETLQAEGDLQQAIDVFQQALQIWPHLSQAWPRKGRIYLELGQYIQAEQAFERAVQADPSNVELLNDLGVSILYQNRIHPALGIFETVLELDAEYAPAHFNRALSFLVLNEDEAAEIEIDAFLNLRPNDPAGLKEKAYLLAARGAYADALDKIQVAIEQASDWAALYIDAAAVAALMGDVDAAIRFLDGAEEWVGPDVITQIYQQPAFRSVRLTEAGLDYQKLLDARERSRVLDEQFIAETLVGGAPMPSLHHPNSVNDSSEADPDSARLIEDSVIDSPVLTDSGPESGQEVESEAGDAEGNMLQNEE